jgi:hypothetical protein
LRSIWGFDQLAGMSLQKAGKLLGSIVQWWRSSPYVKIGWLVIVGGLGIMVPGPRDLLLAVGVAAVNWVLACLQRPPLPPDATAPWWAGLILVVLGLLFLSFQSRSRIRIVRIEEKDGRVTIYGEIVGSDVADPQRLLEKAMEQKLKEVTGE